jgi:alpha-tubulin suppressor-like RCC1 family protein
VGSTTSDGRATVYRGRPPCHEEREIELAVQHRDGVSRHPAPSALRVATPIVVSTALVAILVAVIFASPLAGAATMAARPTPQLLVSAAKAWGFNEDGELGDGRTQNSAVPVEVSGLRGVVAIASGSHHSLALLDDGTVMAWGENVYGQLGDGNSENSDVPVRVSDLSQVAAIAAGEDHSLALLTDGTVMAWGRNIRGQLGDGTTTSSDVPVRVTGLSEVAAVSAGGSFSLALLKDGTVRSWGENFHGQLGNGTEQDSDVPVAVRSLVGVKAISAGFRHGLALMPDGTVAAWGDNEYGQLGDGTESARDAPVPVSSLSGASAISAGVTHSLAVVRGGAVLAWGNNAKGQLGDGRHTGPEGCGAPPVFPCSKVPTPVSALRGVTAVSAGGHSLALLGDGAVMAWGPNNAGQLGDGSSFGPEVCGPSAKPCSTIPVRSSTRGPVLAVSSGTEFSLVLGAAPNGALPELGRCIRVPSGGAYRGASARCVTPSAGHNGHFEWLPGPGSSPKLKQRLSEPKLETVNGGKLSCLEALLEGEYTDARTETISHLMFSGCIDPERHTSCQTTPLEAGVLEASVPLEGSLGFLASPRKREVGWEIRPTPPATALVSFMCGSGVTTVDEALEGSLVAHVTPLNQMVSTFGAQYKQRAGKQIPESLSGAEPNVLTLTSTTLMREPAAAQAGLASSGELEGEEPLEIKAKA